MKKIFIAATRQNHGKTMVSMGLFNAFQQRFKKVAYMKPVGQQYKLVNGKKIDKDAVLFHSIYQLSDPLSCMSPIAIPGGFTTDYILEGNRDALVQRVTEAFERVGRDKDFLLIEGTGHAGVGSVFDLSNAEVARLLNTRVLLVAQGGIGKPIDEITLNKALFDRKGVKVIGVIINKVDPEKYDKINDVVRKGLARHDIPVFGVIPLVNMLKTPSVAELAEDIDARILTKGGKLLNNPIEKFVIGDMLPHMAVDSLSGNALLIIPGNRDGIIAAALCAELVEPGSHGNVSAMVFTEGIRPHHKIMNLIERSGIPVMLVKEDSFTIATKINNSIFKVRVEELDKIKQSQELIEQYIDVDNICSLL